MSILTAIMGLVKGVDSDDTEGYLTGGLADSLEKLDTHQHSDGPDGRAVKALAAGAVGLGGLTVAGTLGSSAETDPTSGQGIYLDFNGTRGELFVQNFDTNSLLPLSLNGLVWIYPSGGVFIGASPTDPGAGKVQISGAIVGSGGIFTPVLPPTQAYTGTHTGDFIVRELTDLFAGLPLTVVALSLTFTWQGAAAGDQIRIYADANTSVASAVLVTDIGGNAVYGSVLMGTHHPAVYYETTTAGGTWTFGVVVNGYQYQ